MNGVLKTTMDLIKIKSVANDEASIQKAVEYCKKYFGKKKVFFKVFRYKGAAPVVLVSNKNIDGFLQSSPTLPFKGREKPCFDIMCVGHLDVVPAKAEQFKPRIDGDRLYGRGSLDMKAAIALALRDLEYVVDNKLDIGFAVLMTTDEETTSNGIKNFVKAEPNIGARIIFDNDAGYMHLMIEKYKHSVSVKLTAKGIAGHSSRPWSNVNAATGLIGVINELQKIFPQYSAKRKMPKSAWVDTMEVTGINSPVTMNITPATAEALLNFRLTEKTSLKDLEKILKKAAKGGDVDYEVIMSSCGCYMDANAKEIKHYKKLAEKVVGEKIKIGFMNGATDARMFADKSVIIMHGLDGAGEHSDNEYLVISSLEKMVVIHERFINDAAGGKV